MGIETSKNSMIFTKWNTFKFINYDLNANTQSIIKIPNELGPVGRIFVISGIFVGNRSPAADEMFWNWQTPFWFFLPEIDNMESIFICQTQCTEIQNIFRKWKIIKLQKEAFTNHIRIVKWKAHRKQSSGTSFKNTWLVTAFPTR